MVPAAIQQLNRMRGFLIEAVAKTAADKFGCCD